MNRITEKISLPMAIVISAVVLAVGFYVVQSNKQESIERQQMLKAQEDRAATEKEYKAKRKTDCLDIYKTENDKWNNVKGWRYDEITDLCYIAYKESNPKSKAQCEKSLDDAKAIWSPDPVPPSTFMTYLNCLEGIFENSF